MKVVTNVNALKRGHKKEIIPMKQSFKHTWLLGLLILPMVFFKAPDADNPVEVDASYAPYQIPNGGFESGNLDGWSRYGIWKGEEGNQAFHSDLVVNGTYFDGHYPYNRDGSYNLGVVGGSVAWSQSEERLGYLRSSNFVLGGSGWISFKLGGGRVQSFAYMSVRRSADDVEVARFGNRFWNNTTRATTVYKSSISNAEAFLFPYYFDLSTVTSIGTGLYILLCDTAGYNWSVLSADSFVTYYASAPSPTPSGDDLAVNIVPSISSTGAYTQSNLTNLSGSLTGWTDVDNIWKTDSGFCRSDNNGGDASMGVLRSSAFNITPEYDHIRMGWGGRLQADKQIFLSIKEVGSNTEMIRILHRWDKKDYVGDGRENAMIDLTFLNGNPTTKEYYMEISDNTTEGYGLNFVNNVHFVTDADFNSVVSSYPNDEVMYLWNGAQKLGMTDDPPKAPPYYYTGLAISFGVDYIQESASYGAYFIQQTASYCATLEGGSAPWATLGTEYATLSDAAKDYFVAGGTTEVNVLAARERYEFMITKYTAFQSNNFLVDHLGTEYVPAYANNIFSNTKNDLTNSLFLIGLVAISGLSVLAYMIIRKKKVTQ